MTRLADIFNFLVTNFPTKVSQTFCIFLAVLILQLSCKNDLATFWSISGIIGQFFIQSSGHTGGELPVAKSSLNGTILVTTAPRSQHWELRLSLPVIFNL